MSRLRIGEREIECEAGETVLDALLRTGVDHPYSCRSGACLSCLARVKVGEVPESARAGLSAPLRARGFFLPCITPCETDLVIESAGDQELEVKSRIVRREARGGDVIVLRIEPQAAFECRAGQFIQIVRTDGLVRSYSVANLPDIDGNLELHVKVVRGGAMSNYLAKDVAIGDGISIRGPGGSCFYVKGRPDQPLVLAGTGTGIAPLLGILRDALRHEHRGEILVLHGALDPVGLYARPELEAIARANPNVEVLYSALEARGEAIDTRPLDRRLFDRKPSFAQHRVFLCGAPAVVNSLRREVFLRGASLREIHADAFVTRADSTPSTPSTR